MGFLVAELAVQRLRHRRIPQVLDCLDLDRAGYGLGRTLELGTRRYIGLASVGGRRIVFGLSRRFEFDAKIQRLLDRRLVRHVGSRRTKRPRELGLRRIGISSASIREVETRECSHHRHLRR